MHIILDKDDVPKTAGISVTTMASNLQQNNIRLILTRPNICTCCNAVLLYLISNLVVVTKADGASVVCGENWFSLRFTHHPIKKNHKDACFDCLLVDARLNKIPKDQMTIFTTTILM